MYSYRNKVYALWRLGILEANTLTTSNAYYSVNFQDNIEMIDSLDSQEAVLLRP